MRLVIYARYSTERQGESSIEDQIALCRRYAERMGWEVVAVYSDAAISGTHTERDGLQRMLADAAKRPRAFDAILVESQSRLSRDLFGALELIYRDLARHGVRVVDAAGWDSSTEMGEMQTAVQGLFNAQYVKQVAKMTHRGLDARARVGFSTGGSIFGYETVAEAHVDPEHARKAWRICEPEAVIVRRIFEAFDGGGVGYRAIADELNREGIASPRNNGRGGKHGAGWCHSSVRAVLTNEKYIGRFVWNTHKWTRLPGERKRHRSRRPETEHVACDMPELAIVDRALFDRVQARIAKHHRHSHVRPDAGKRPYLLSGLLRCGVCGGPISVSGQRVKNGIRYATFGCTAHRSRGGSICPNNATISEKRIVGGVLEALRKLLTGPQVREAFASAFERRVAERAKKTSGPDLERQLAAAQKRVSNATRLLVEDPDDLEIRRMREDARADVRRLDAEIASAAEDAPRQVPDREALEGAISTFLDTLATAAPDVGRQVLSRVLPEALVLEPTPKNQKPGVVVTGSLSLSALYTHVAVAGAGFEPATFGL